MNRAQRRAQDRQRIGAALADVHAEQRRLETQLRDQARAIRAASPAPGETPQEALQAVERSIADLSAPAYALVAGPALGELRGLRDDLAARVRAH